MASASMCLAADQQTELMELEFERKLIQSVKLRSALTDRHNTQYYSSHYNEIAWRKVSKEHTKSVLKCIDKWYSLVHLYIYYQNMRKRSASTEPIKWPHFDALNDVESIQNTKYIDLVQHGLSLAFHLPVHRQKEELVNCLMYHRSSLLNPQTTILQAHNIWARIASKLNNDGVVLPIIKWQECWCEMKIKLINRMPSIQLDMQMKRGSSIVEHLTYHEMNILDFFGVKSTDRIASINAVMWSNIELGNDMSKIIHRCRKCSTIMENFLNRGYCDTCSKYSKLYCDLCTKTHEHPTTVYQIKDWSEKAKNLFPRRLQSFSELSMCFGCFKTMKKKAAEAWMVCRVCESQDCLEYLYASKNEELRKLFNNATKVQFSEFDGLPAYICKACHGKMLQFNDFYLTFSRTQMRLLRMHATQFIHIEKKSSNSTNSEVGEKHETYIVIPDSPPPSVKVIPPSNQTSAAESPTTKLVFIDSPSSAVEVIPSSNPPNLAENPETTLIIPLNRDQPLVEPCMPPNKAHISNKLEGSPKFAGNKIRKRIISSKNQATISKRVCIAPTNTIGVVSLQSSTSESLQQTLTPMIISPLPTNSEPVPLFTANTGVTISKRICTTQPEIFRTNQSTQSPTVFDLPNAGVSVHPLMPTEMPKPNGLLNISPQITIIPQPPKETKVIDDDYPQGETSSSSSIISTEPAKNIPNTKPNNLKAALLNDTTGQNSAIIPPKPASLPYTFQNEFLTSKIFPRKGLELIPLYKNYRPSTSKNTKKQQINQQQKQGQHKPTSASANIQMRKNDDSLNEIQVISVPEKAFSVPNPTTQDARNSVQQALHTTPSSGHPSEVEIKIEVDDQTDQSMFYPDSFELNKLSLDDVDVSLILKNMITNNVSMNSIMNSDNYNYTNPLLTKTNMKESSNVEQAINDKQKCNKNEKPKERHNNPGEFKKQSEVQNPDKTIFESGELETVFLSTLIEQTKPINGVQNTYNYKCSNPSFLTMESTNNGNLKVYKEKTDDKMQQHITKKNEKPSEIKNPYGPPKIDDGNKEDGNPKNDDKKQQNIAKKTFKQVVFEKPSEIRKPGGSVKKVHSNKEDYKHKIDYTKKHNMGKKMFEMMKLLDESKKKDDENKGDDNKKIEDKKQQNIAKKTEKPPEIRKPDGSPKTEDGNKRDSKQQIYDNKHQNMVKKFDMPSEIRKPDGSPKKFDGNKEDDKHKIDYTKKHNMGKKMFEMMKLLDESEKKDDGNKGDDNQKIEDKKQQNIAKKTEKPSEIRKPDGSPKTEDGNKRDSKQQIYDNKQQNMVKKFDMPSEIRKPDGSPKKVDGNKEDDKHKIDDKKQKNMPKKMDKPLVFENPSEIKKSKHKSGDLETLTLNTIINQKDHQQELSNKNQKNNDNKKNKSKRADQPDVFKKPSEFKKTDESPPKLVKPDPVPVKRSDRLRQIALMQNISIGTRKSLRRRNSIAIPY